MKVLDSYQINSIILFKVVAYCNAIYTLRFFLLQLMPPCTYRQTDVTFSTGEEGFQWSGVAVTSPGFTSAMPWKKVDAVECSAAIRKGDSWEMKEVWSGSGGCGQGVVGVVKD